MVKVHTLVIGSGAAGLAAALRLKREGVHDLLLVSEGLKYGTSINTGSDKQTYYKQGIYGEEPDSPALLAKTLFDGGSVHGDIALVEASLSLRCFMNLVNLGVPFPADAFGQFIGYKTDHDPKCRATSCGPYTSREMCNALIRAVKELQIEIWEDCTVAELITLDHCAAGAVICHNKSGELEPVMARHTVFATGGPGGLYENSVYPGCHFGSIGLALEKGAKAQNLPESQFGIASTRFRWNVSGSYMQVLPRFVSVNQDGSDEKEFLTEYFGNDSGLMNTMVFLKGYQWPFDVRKAETGSSVIDLLVHREIAEKNRRVFLDFQKNPANLDFSKLSGEAYTYLERSGILFGTPFERLNKMNPLAISLYREHNIDLAAEMLEIAVCAQHNNGGLTGNIWYESPNLKNLFPIGEVNGSHGVTRPGGSALNAGQVGAFRCAEWIAHAGNVQVPDEQLAAEEAEKICQRLKCFLAGTRDVVQDRKEFQHRMSLFAGHLRNVDDLKKACGEAEKLYRNVMNEGYCCKSVKQALFNRHLIFSHWAYLSAILFQVESGTGSRGSGAVLDGDHKIVPEDPGFRQMILETHFDGNGFKHCWVPCRAIPESNGWFETVWAAFREQKNYATLQYEN